MEWLAILLAIAGGFTYALAAVLQQRVAAEQPSELSLSFKLIVELFKRPLWLLGTALDVCAYVLEAAALGVGSVVIVGPLLVSGLLFAIPLAQFGEGRARHEPRDGPGGRGDARPRPLRRRRFTRGRCVAGVDDGLDRGGHGGGCRGDRADDRGSRREQRRDARAPVRTRDGHALRADRGAHEVDRRPLRQRRRADVHALAAVRRSRSARSPVSSSTRARSRPVTSRRRCRPSRS